jgi:hypothetical protein
MNFQDAIRRLQANSGGIAVYVPMNAASEQPVPTEGTVEIAALVRADIEARAVKGEQTYGKRLQAHNGRDALLDAYQEALDLCMYLRQAIAERDSK